MVREPESEQDIWWGGASPNHPMEEDEFLKHRDRCLMIPTTSRLFSRCSLVSRRPEISFVPLNSSCAVQEY